MSVRSMPARPSRRLMRALLLVTTSFAAIGGGVAVAADDAPVIDPRYASFPPPVIAGDPQIPSPPSLGFYSMSEREVVLEWRDGTPKDGRYEYEILVDGRVIQRQNPGNTRSGEVPFRTTQWIGSLEPGTTYEFGVRRVLPDERRSPLVTVKATTKGTPVSLAERPPVPKLNGVRARATSATLDFESGQIIEPFEATTTGFDVRLPGREETRGGTSNGALWISGLKPSTSYTVQVRTRDVGNDTSAWVPFTFRTTALPADVSLPSANVKAVSTAEYKTTISWTPARDAWGELAIPWYSVDGDSGRPLVGDEDYEKPRTEAIYDDTGAEPGSTHSVKVWLVDKDGRKGPVSSATYTYPDTRPKNIRALAGWASRSREGLVAFRADGNWADSKILIDGPFEAKVIFRYGNTVIASIPKVDTLDPAIKIVNVDLTGSYGTAHAGWIRVKP